jgi:hypothetical protein
VMVYFCDFGRWSLVAYFSGSGLTDCEWLVPGSYDPSGVGSMD